MLTSLALLAVVQAKDVGPAPPAGSSRMFQTASIEVQKSLSLSEFATAEAGLRALPDRTLTVGWEPAQLPERRRAPLRQGMERAIAAWEEAIEGLEIEFAEQAEVMVTFVEELPPNPENGRPQSAVFFESLDPSEPRVEAVLALRRGTTQSPTTDTDLHNELGYAIGRALGLAHRPGQGTFGTRSDGSYGRDYTVGTIEARIVAINFQVGEILRNAVAKRLSIEPAIAEAFITPMEIDVGRVPQGEMRQFNVQITNRGKVPLFIGMQPDCSCFFVQAPGEIGPGQTAAAVIHMDTTYVPGDIDKRIHVYTNDHERPARTLHFTGRVEPLYEFIQPFPSGTVVVEDRDEAVQLYLKTDPGRNVSVSDISVTGPASRVIWKPFSGQVKDGEGVTHRIESGFELTVMLKKQELLGRRSVSLSAQSSSELFPRMDWSFFVQSGIAAQPNRLYFGEIDDRPTEAVLFLSRPGRQFKITGLTASNPEHFEVESYDRRGGWEYGIVVRYKGGLPFGPFASSVRIATDSPLQPVLEIPIEGTIG